MLILMKGKIKYINEYILIDLAFCESRFPFLPEPAGRFADEITKVS